MIYDTIKGIEGDIMYSYIKGTIVALYSDSIVLDNQGIGYLVYVSNPYQFEKNKEYTVYIFQSITENDMRLYGFKTSEQKDLFLMLIKVKGIGPKSAIAIIAAGETKDIIQAIEDSNVKFLRSFPGIGPKAASQIILDLKGKFNGVERLESSFSVSPSYQEAVEVLIALGYKELEAEKAMKQISEENLDTNGYVKKALALMTLNK